MRKNTGKIRRFDVRNKEEYYFDYSLLFVVLFLLGFGLVMIYSASSYDASTSKCKSLFANAFGIL